MTRKLNIFIFLIIFLLLAEIGLVVFFNYQNQSMIQPEINQLQNAKSELANIKTDVNQFYAQMQNSTYFELKEEVSWDEIHKRIKEISDKYKGLFAEHSGKLGDAANNFENTAAPLKRLFQELDSRDEKKKASIKSYTNDLMNFKIALQDEIEKIIKSFASKIEVQNQKLATNSMLIFVIVGFGGLLAIIFVLLILVSLKKTIEKPIKMFQDLFAAKDLSGLKKSELNQNEDFKMILTKVAILNDQKEISETFINKVANGTYNNSLPNNSLPTTFATSLNTIQDELKGLIAKNKKTTDELDDLKANWVKKEEEYKNQVYKLTAQVSSANESILIAESTLDGKISYINKAFIEITGLKGEEVMNKPFSLLSSGFHDKDFYKQIWESITKGAIWKGVFRNVGKNGKVFWLAATIVPIRDYTGNLSKFILIGFDITWLKQDEEAQRLALSTALKDADLHQRNFRKLSEEKEEYKKSFEAQKEIENRLINQQAALQDLNRNVDLLEGKIGEVIKTITETTVYTLDHDRVGFWLLIDNNTKLRLVDLYDRQTLQHIEGFELSEKNFPNFFGAFQTHFLLQIEDALNDYNTTELVDSYLITYGITSMLCAAIKMGGTVVGILSLEHVGKPTKFSPDKSTFLTAVSDIISVALEHGNRRVMEEELRTSLEESQALEEELRQNAEEIEATNEELKRAQIELKGQIEALNFAAIVSETNLTGIITYANEEFLQVYQLTKEEVLGKSHSIIKSNEHDAEFFRHMWVTITHGRVWKGEIKNKSKEGWNYWISMTITPVIGHDGRPYKYIGVGFNISSQKLQEEQLKTALEVALQQEEMLRENTEELFASNEEMRRTQIELTGQITALNNSSMVYETDMEGNITYVNEQLLKELKYSREDLMGSRYSIMKSPRQAEKVFQEQWKAILNGKFWEGELELKSKDDKYIWVLFNSTPVLDSDNEPIKSINVLNNITAQKEQEFRLKNQQSALLEITSNSAIKEGNLEEAFNFIAQIGLETLEVDRASIWMFEDNDQKIRCMAAYQKNATHKHNKGTILQKDLYPNYFKTLEKDRIIAAADAINDPRTKDLAIPLLVPSGISAILDASIRHGARAVGIISFEFKDTVRNWTVDEQGFAASLADAVALVLEQKERLRADKLKQAYEQLEDINKEVMRQKQEIEQKTVGLTESIRYAKRIQANILPSKEIMNEMFENYFVIYRPRDIVGGDFYWFAMHNEFRVVVCADGTGHGVPGAFLTLIGHILLNQIVNEKKILNPSEILYYLHLGVRQTLKQDSEDSQSRDGMDVTMFTLNMNTLECQYAGANLPFNYYQDWEVHQVKPDKQSIGGEQMEEERTFTNNIIQLREGDAIYLYTDGFVDQLGGPGEKRFSTRRFRDLVLRTQHESMATQRALLNMEWKEWKNDNEQLDDVTVFGLKL